MPERPDMEGPWHGDDEWASCHLGDAVKPRFEHIARRSKMIYFLRKKGTTDQFYQRRGGRKCHYGCKRGTRTTVWGPRHTAACWTSPRGPRAVKGQDGEVVAFSLSSEEGRVVV
jgi:hypothetical protein